MWMYKNVNSKVLNQWFGEGGGILNPNIICYRDKMAVKQYFDKMKTLQKKKKKEKIF